MHFPAFEVARATCRGRALSGAGRKDKPLGSSSPGKKETKSTVVTPAEPLASCKNRKSELRAVKLSGTEKSIQSICTKNNLLCALWCKIVWRIVKTARFEVLSRLFRGGSHPSVSDAKETSHHLVSPAMPQKQLFNSVELSCWLDADFC